jgi:hypothetical protein
MNPGMIDPATDTLIHDEKLQTRLDSLLTKITSSTAPFDQDPFKAFIRRSNGKIRVALVDLSSAMKLVSPTIAESNSTIETYAASLAKLAALYAAHQLRFDLNEKARNGSLSLTSAALNSLKRIFDVTVGSGGAIQSFEFKTAFRNHLRAICEDCDATTVIDAVGFQFIASSMWQSGLFHCKRGGLWLGGDYDACGDPRRTWNGILHGVTALSATSFFTLLAQGRLIDDASTKSITDALIAQRSGCNSAFEEGLTAAGLVTPGFKIISKIGFWGGFSHEGALIERSDGARTIRYALCVLTQCDDTTGDESQLGWRVLQRIIVQLDEFVRTNP